MIEVNNGVAGVKSIQLAVEGALQHAPLPHEHLPHCVQQLRAPVGDATRRLQDDAEINLISN